MAKFKKTVRKIFEHPVFSGEGPSNLGYVSANHAHFPTSIRVWVSSVWSAPRVTEEKKRRKKENISRAKYNTTPTMQWYGLANTY